MPSFPTQLEPGAFLETLSVLDVLSLPDNQVRPELKELMIRLVNTINNMSLMTNLKDSGYYPLTEFVNGQAYFPNPALGSNTQQQPTLRQVFRLVINFGQLPNAGAKSVAHGLTVTNAFTFTRIYGAASDTTGHNYIPLPYASPTLANNTSIDVDGTNVTVTTGSNRTNFNISYIILEYIKQ